MSVPFQLNRNESTMSAKVTKPNVVHVGKRKKKDVGKLAKGGGPLMDEVMAAVARAQGDSVQRGDSVQQVVPVVLVYEQKPRRKKRGMAIMGPMF
jgi:hypothetical protein